MHEMGIVQNIIDIVLQEMDRHGVEKLKTIHLVVGRMSAIVPEQLRMCFEILTTGHRLAGADLAIRLAPVIYRCPDCDSEFTAEGIIFKCPECEAAHPEIIFGRELKIESIEVMD
jgi:hydrogenase nickel incorporation protein HypA/HybF